MDHALPMISFLFFGRGGSVILQFSHFFSKYEYNFTFKKPFQNLFIFLKCVAYNQDRLLINESRF